MFQFEITLKKPCNL